MVLESLFECPVDQLGECLASHSVATASKLFLAHLPPGSLLSLPVGARVDVPRQQLPGFVPALPRELQRDLGIDPHRDALFHAREAVLEAPSLRAARGDFEVEAAAVVELARLLAGLDLADGRWLSAACWGIL